MKSFKEMYPEEELNQMKKEVKQKFQNIDFLDIVHAIEFKLEEINPRTAEDMIVELENIIKRYRQTANQNNNKQDGNGDVPINSIDRFNENLQ